MKYVTKFTFEISSLDDPDFKVLQKLIEAAELISPIYEAQKNDKFLGANFYPHDATYEEVKSASEKIPELLDPYTVVKRDKRGELYPVYFHEEYHDLLVPISQKLEEASELCRTKYFSDYLRVKSKTLLDGNNKLADEVWVRTPQYKLDIVIGPMERYLDKLFFTKMGYMAAVQILDEERTKEAEKIKDAIYATTRLFREFGIRRISPGESVQVRFDNNVIYAGLISETAFVGEHLPSDIDVVKKVGSRILVYLTCARMKFKRNIFPIFKRIFDHQIISSFSFEDLFGGYVHLILLHEVTHQIHKYDGAIRRLGDQYPVVDELNGEVSGMQLCRHLVMKGVISVKQLEAIMLAHLVWCFSILKVEKPIYSAYSAGCAFALTFYKREKIIEVRKGKLHVDLSRMFFAIEDLSDICIGFLKEGRREDAKVYFGSNLDNSIVNFANRLP